MLAKSTGPVYHAAMNTISIILPAAGTGSRFGAGENKIFKRLDAEPIFLKTCRRFARRDDVGQLLLVVSDSDAERLQTEFGQDLIQLGIQLIEGGATRTESVRNALAEIDEQAEWIAVHDAVRPCVPEADIEAVFAAAVEHGAALLAWPEHATLKEVDEAGVVRRTVDRAGLWQAQTPQVFRADWLVEAYEAAGESGTDDAALVEAIGQAVHVVRGDPRNIKITTPRDLEIAEAVWPTLS
jgi:2-C-methyl-D-erythritol 4-phosphate cytidylyltransferase